MTSWYNESFQPRDLHNAPVEMSEGHLICDGERVTISSLAMCMYHFSIGAYDKGLRWLPAHWFHGPVDLASERAEGISVNPETTLAEFMRRVTELRD